MLSSDETLLYWIGVNLDIEERKQAEFYLGEGQRLAHIGSWAFKAGAFDYWSPELFRIHELDPNRKAPTVDEYMALVHPEDREFVAEAIEKMLLDHRSFDFTKRIVRPDGEIRHLRCVGTAATHGGTVGGFVGTGKAEGRGYVSTEFACVSAGKVMYKALRTLRKTSRTLR